MSDLKRYQSATTAKLKTPKVTVISVKKLSEAITEAATHAKPGSRSIIERKDRCLEENPYLLLYGENIWEEKIKNCTGLKKIVCINGIVYRIYKSSKNMFKGTKGEKT